MTSLSVPTGVTDPINQQILAVSEDRVHGFAAEPFARIAEMTGLDQAVIIERIRAMLQAGTIRRVRQTLMTTSLAPGALVAWQVPAARLNRAFDWLFENDPFTGHVVIRTTDERAAGAQYRLWTTLKVPVGFSMQRHVELLLDRIGGEDVRLMPAKKVFALGVGHIRRRGLEPGARAEQPGKVRDATPVQLDPEQWRVLLALKRELSVDEIAEQPWRGRAEEAGMNYDRFIEIAEGLERANVIGRFSTFLEHVKKLADGAQVTRYNALFHWAVPSGREIDAGCEVGRHLIMTHAYWRQTGPQFNHVNIMGVAHGEDRDLLLAHKEAIDRHLEEAGIAVRYTNVFWGGRSEIKPSEIDPRRYAEWLTQQGIDPASMRDGEVPVEL